MTGAKIGIRPAPASDGIERAVSAAARADAVILVVGTDENWETEGADRESMHLPGAQDELVQRVLEVAPHAIVVLNVGAPVATPWATDAGAVVQCWFGGQEMATGLVDILFGESDPGGRLPSTIPMNLEDNPSWGNSVPESGRVRYGEGVLGGYRWYESRNIDVSFPFGHGLSYTSFEIGAPVLSTPTIEPGGSITVRIPVTNTGSRPGTEIVQLYVAPKDPGAFRPPKELKGFAKASLTPGESTILEIELGDPPLPAGQSSIRCSADSRHSWTGRLLGAPARSGRRERMDHGSGEARAAHREIVGRDRPRRPRGRADRRSTARLSPQILLPSTGVFMN